MANFSQVTVTDAGRQLINSLVAGQTIEIPQAQVGSGTPATGVDLDGLTQLVHFVMDADATSANDQVLYQTTVRIRVSSQYAPYQFQLNEIGIFAAIGASTPILFAYASAGTTGDTITPDPTPSAVVYDYAVLIQYESDVPTNTTVTITPVLELHAATHRGNGIDPIGLADTTASGLLTTVPGDATKVLLGSNPQSWGPIPLPAGVMMEYGGATAPPGWLLCDGSAISRTIFAALYAVIGTTYGAGDGSVTFNLPDARGRTMIGAGQGTGLSSRTLGAKGGEESHVLSMPELAAHTHTVNDLGHTHTLNEGSGHSHVVTDPGHAHTLNEGAGHTHGITQTAHAHDIDDTGHTHNTETLNFTYTPQPPIMQVPLYDPVPNQWWVRDMRAVSSKNATGVNVKPALANLVMATVTTGAWIANSVSRVTINLAQTGMAIISQVTGITNANTGGNGAHNNMQPFLAVNMIIKT
jgi:microcystin-dependent protein